MALKKKKAKRLTEVAQAVASSPRMPPAAAPEKAVEDIYDDEASAEALRAMVDLLGARLLIEARPANGGTIPSGVEALAKGHALELATLLGHLQQRLTALRSVAGAALDRFAEAPAKPQPSDGEVGSSNYVEMKVQLLLSYIICLVYYLLLKARGIPVRDHPVVPRLFWIRSLLEKLRPVDQRLQYQIGKLLQWADGKVQAEATTVADAHSLRPGELAIGVEDEGAEAEAEEAEAQAEEAKDGAYRPPKIAEMEYTGDHVSLQERAERDLERTKARLERSQFMRTLREEFTDAPTEIHGSQKSAKAEKAARMVAEQQEYEEDHMVRLRTSKREARIRSRVIREGRSTGTGVATLGDISADFDELSRGRRPSGRKGRKNSVLEEYQAAEQRVHRARGVVASALDVLPSGTGRKRGGGGKPPGKKRRK